jgi:hypothetical protein
MAERASDADRRWAEEHAPRLVAQARADALEHARRTLRDGLVDALLEAAQRQGGAPARAGREPSAEAPGPSAPGDAPGEAERGDAVWLYGILRGDAPQPAPLAGVDGRRVELIRHAGLAALTGAVPLERFGEQALRDSLEDMERLETLARAHERVLDHALELGAVVPCRICTIYADADHVRAMLEAERAPLMDALAQVEGAAEWGVKAFRTARPEAAADPRVAVPASGTDYLTRRREAREEAEASVDGVIEALESVHARLSEQATAAVVIRPQDRRLSGREEEMVLNAAYLVPDARADQFRTLVDELGRGADGVELELSGPWPPYHFVETTQGP